MTKIGRMLFEDGMEEGRVRGREEGREESRRKTAENMLRDGMEWEKIKKYTDLTEAEIIEIEKDLLVSQ